MTHRCTRRNIERPARSPVDHSSAPRPCAQTHFSLLYARLLYTRRPPHPTTVSNLSLNPLHIPTAKPHRRPLYTPHELVNHKHKATFSFLPTSARLPRTTRSQPAISLRHCRGAQTRPNLPSPVARPSTRKSAPHNPRLDQKPYNTYPNKTQTSVRARAHSPPICATSLHLLTPQPCRHSPLPALHLHPTKRHQASSTTLPTHPNLAHLNTTKRSSTHHPPLPTPPNDIHSKRA